MEKAQVTLPSDSEVEVTRTFSAKLASVWRAYVEPALIKRWMLGPPGWTMPVCEMDLRVGGQYRWRWRSNEDQTEFGFHGEFREIEAGARIVHTQVYDPGDTGFGETGDPALISLRFIEKDGVTTVTTRMDFGSKAGRDAVVATGMTEGMEAGYHLLDAVLPELS